MTRQKIIESAIEVLNSDFNASLEKIAENVSLNRRTLHRYFKDRDVLLEACWVEMITTWQNLVLEVCRENNDLIVQLKSMFGAGIDNGVKYSFLVKLYKRAQEGSPLTAVDNPAYEQVRDKWLSSIPELQNQQLINDQMSTSWILILFSNMIISSVEALRSGEFTSEEIKKLGWYSFSRGIGLIEK